MVYVVLLTGSQRWTDRRPIRRHLIRVRDEHPGEELVLRHGACPRGADNIGHWIGVQLGYRPDPHPVHWRVACDPLFCKPNHRMRNSLDQLYCPAAGVRRSQHMIDLELRPSEGIAFIKDDSPGSSYCVRAMRAAGIPVRGVGVDNGMLPLALEDV